MGLQDLTEVSEPLAKGPVSGPSSGNPAPGLGSGAGLGVPLVAPFPEGLSLNQGPGQGRAWRAWASGWFWSGAVPHGLLGTLFLGHEWANALEEMEASGATIRGALPAWTPRASLATKCPLGVRNQSRLLEQRSEDR